MPNTISIEIDAAKLKEIVIEYLQDKVNISIDPKDISIETKSAQNYRSEWETAHFRARVEASI